MRTDIETLMRKNEKSFYVFDAEQLRQRTRQLRAFMPEGTGLCYAVKANTFVVRELLQDVDRFEICSPGELEICLRLGVPEEKMVISGVYKSGHLIRKMTSGRDFGGIFTVESMRQYQLLRQQADTQQHRISVLLRLTNGSQFGMDRTCVEQIIADREKCPHMDIRGIQFFSGTQKTSIKKLKRELEMLDDFLLRLREKLGYEAVELEYGAGLPVQYFREEPREEEPSQSLGEPRKKFSKTMAEPREEELLQAFGALLAERRAGAKLTVELGRSIAAGCGTYYTCVVDKKQNKGQNYLLVEGGMHQLVYYGQQMAMKHPFLTVCGRENWPIAGKWNICGSLCTMNDILVKQAALPETDVGDWLCFHNTGAYCMTEGIALFLTRNLPAVYLRSVGGEIVRVRPDYGTAGLNMPVYEQPV